VSPKDIQVVGRVAVARGLRLDALSNAPSAPAAAAESRDVACSRCGAVLCEAARRPLFAGMVLACNRCSEKTRVDRA
jgi:hypothetical protein